MTRYVCAHPSHAHRVDEPPVDLTSQVRLERGLIPRPAAYLAITEHVIHDVHELELETWKERRDAIEHRLAGTAVPVDLPVVLLSEQTITKPPGLYELDHLLPTDPATGRVVGRLGGSPGQDDLLVLEDDDDEEPVEAPTWSAGGTGTPSSGLQAVKTRPATRSRIVPQGVFLLSDLSASLAAVAEDEDQIAHAIRTTPRLTIDEEPPSAPWRVSVTCPIPEGEDLAHHEMVFTGAELPEPALVYGTPVDAWDAQIERGTATDLAPPAELTRVERRITALMIIEVATIATLAMLGWASGALGQAARETPGWLGLSFVLAATAVAMTAVPLFATRDPYTNPNDLFVAGRHYAGRVGMLRWGAAISGLVFGLALVTAIAPPLFDRSPTIPAATVTFDPETIPVTVTRPVTFTTPVEFDGAVSFTTPVTFTAPTTTVATVATPVSATVTVRVPDVGAGDLVEVQMREFLPGDETGILVGNVTRFGDPSGSVRIATTVALDPGIRYLSVLVVTAGSDGATCTPADPATPGCTVVAVPQTAA